MTNVLWHWRVMKSTSALSGIWSTSSASSLVIVSGVRISLKHPRGQNSFPVSKELFSNLSSKRSIRSSPVVFGSEYILPESGRTCSG
ncbi:hypothetical protein F5883DRAFT_531252 [Diaporthe sp. PMI_573]|nr:hypothetical protein F5883DRAFT_531252 [Diaporthaceae sp. PMI_573]